MIAQQRKSLSQLNSWQTGNKNRKGGNDGHANQPKKDNF